LLSKEKSLILKDQFNKFGVFYYKYMLKTEINNEKNISTKQTQKSEQTRIPIKNVHEEWTRCSKKKARQRKKEINSKR